MYQVRSCHTHSTSGDAPIEAPPTSLKDGPLLALHAADRAILTHQRLFSEGLRRNHNVQAFAEIMCHRAWEWQDYTESVTKVTRGGRAW